MARVGINGCVHDGVSHAHNVSGTRGGSRAGGHFVAVIFPIARHIVSICVACVW